MRRILVCALLLSACASAPPPTYSSANITMQPNPSAATATPASNADTWKRSYCASDRANRHAHREQQERLDDAALANSGPSTSALPPCTHTTTLRPTNGDRDEVVRDADGTLRVQPTDTRGVAICDDDAHRNAPQQREPLRQARAIQGPPAPPLISEQERQKNVECEAEDQRVDE